MEITDAAGSSLETGLLVAATNAAEARKVSPDSASCYASAQAAWEAQDAPSASPMVSILTEHRG
jgi:hypothetical protein